MLTKSKLAIELSKLKVFKSPGLLSEQYPTDSETAAGILWNAYMHGDIQGRTIADLGCGTGILGIGCLLLGAKKVYFVDNDDGALSAAAANIRSLGLKGYEIINSDITEVKLKADVVVQNPPFGTKREHADREFLEAAFAAAGVVYSIHKSSTANFVQKFSSDSGFSITNAYSYSMPLKQSHAFHRRRIRRIEVTCFRFEKS